MQCDGNFIENVERVIEAYNLGKNNKEQYLECREVFNKKYSKPETFNPYMCYALFLKNIAVSSCIDQSQDNNIFLYLVVIFFQIQ